MKKYTKFLWGCLLLSACAGNPNPELTMKVSSTIPVEASDTEAMIIEKAAHVVPKAERQRRSKIMHEVSEEKTKAFYAQQAGREAVVLWESKKEGNMMAGFTENYVKVYRPYEKEKVNTFEVIRM